MTRVRLLKRFMTLDAGGTLQDQSSSHAVLACVGEHLQKILNTRQGSVIQAPDYGIPALDMLTCSFDSKVIRDIEDALAETIIRYEPRLTEVSVHYTPGGNTLLTATFSLRSVIKHKNENIPVVFETWIAPDGRIEVGGYT